MATANQKKPATGKQKPKAGSPGKSTSKSSLSKKNSAMHGSKKPKKEVVKTTTAKKTVANRPAKPANKVAKAAKVKGKTTKADSSSKAKPGALKKTAQSPQKAKISSSKKPASKPAENKKNTAPASPAIKTKTKRTKPTPVRKGEVKSVKPTASQPKKNKVEKPTSKKESSKITLPVNPSPIKKAGGKASTKPAPKPNPSKVVSSDKKAKGDAPEPLQIKAEKAIREMEETMDLSKLRPRIQAGSTVPKPLIRHQQILMPKLLEPTNTAKVKFQLEFEFRSSPKILFTSLSDSSGLAGWFADEVHTKDDIYTFSWEGGDSQAKLVAIRDLQLVRFQWMDDLVDGTYFQFEIKEDDITSDVALIITDFALPGERETNIRLWESQVQKLRMLLGSL